MATQSFVLHTVSFTLLHMSWSFLSRVPRASQKGREPTITSLGTFKALDKPTWWRLCPEGPIPLTIQTNQMLKGSELLVPSKFFLPTPNYWTQSGKLRLLLADSQHSSSHQSVKQKISQHTHPHLPAPLFTLQSSSRAPCLNKRCSMFLGNDEATSHKRKEKIHQIQKAFLENK